MKFLVLLLTLFLGFFTNGQNLIPNPSFEDVNYCETRIPCSPSGWYSVSNVPYGYQNDLPKPLEGKHSIAFLIAYEKEVRSYWQTMILCPLQAQQEYIISFNLYPRNIEFQPKSFGVYLSDTLFRSKNDTIIQKSQNIQIDEQSLSSLKNGWYKITLSYIATGKEKYLLLGNFSINSNEIILKGIGNNIKFFEYYVDNIALKPANKNVTKCTENNTRIDSLFAANTRHAVFHDNKLPETMSDNQVLPVQSKIDTLVLSKINFNFGSAKLVSKKTLNEYFDNINFEKINKIEIVGYTDSIGTVSYNVNLSERRALSVKNYLVNTYKLSNNLIAATGKGIIKDDKILENNRRVELRIYKQ